MSSKLQVGDRFTIRFDEKWKKTELTGINNTQFKLRIYDSQLRHTTQHIYRKPDWINLITQQRIKTGPWITFYPSWLKLSETILCISTENKQCVVGIIADFCDGEWILFYHITYNYLNKNYKNIKQLKYEKIIINNIKCHQDCFYNNKYILFRIPDQYKISTLNIEVQMMNISKPTIQYKQDSDCIYKCQIGFEGNHPQDKVIKFFQSIYCMKELHNKTLTKHLKKNNCACHATNNNNMTIMINSIATEINWVLNELNIFCFAINDLISSYLHDPILYICPATACQPMERVSYAGRIMSNSELPFILGCEFVLNCDMQILGFQICLDGIMNILDEKIYLVQKYKGKNNKIKIFETNSEILEGDFNKFLFDKPIELHGHGNHYQMIIKLKVLKYSFEWHKLNIAKYENLYRINNWKCFETIDWFQCDYRIYNTKTTHLAFDQLSKSNKKRLLAVPHIAFVL